MNAIVDINHQRSAMFKQIQTRFDYEFGVIWSLMNPEPRPCFNKICLTELLQHQVSLRSTDGKII